MSWGGIFNDDKAEARAEAEDRLSRLLSSGTLPISMEAHIQRELEQARHEHRAAERAARPKPSNLDKLSMRMGWHGSRIKTFQHIDIAALPTKVMVWAITKGDFQSVVIEDDLSMFPSDTLVTQLRLLEKT